jgi:hypothetical protein
MKYKCPNCDTKYENEHDRNHCDSWITDLCVQPKMVSCYCGNTMQEHDWIDGELVAIQFCSEKCKVTYS